MLVRFTAEYDGRKVAEFRAEKALYIPGFYTNCLSGKLLRKKGIWVDQWDGNLYFGEPSKRILMCKLQEIHEQSVIEYNAISSYPRIPRSFVGVFVLPALQPGARAARKRRKTRKRDEPRAPRADPMYVWHLRAGHCSPEALERLASAGQNVKFKASEAKAYTYYRLSEAKRVISRRAPQLSKARRPFWRVHFDLFQLDMAYNGHKYTLAFKDEYSGAIVITTLPSKTMFLKSVQEFEARVKRQWGLSVNMWRLDYDAVLISTETQKRREFETWSVREGIEVETPPPYTTEPNGGAERAGGVIQAKQRKMGLAANLPADLWPEVWRAAAYLYNRTPRLRNAWRTPLETLFR